MGTGIEIFKKFVTESVRVLSDPKIVGTETGTGTEFIRKVYHINFNF